MEDRKEIKRCIIRLSLTFLRNKRCVKELMQAHNRYVNTPFNGVLDFIGKFEKLISKEIEFALTNDCYIGAARISVVNRMINWKLDNKFNYWSEVNTELISYIKEKNKNEFIDNHIDFENIWL